MDTTPTILSPGNALIKKGRFRAAGLTGSSGHLDINIFFLPRPIMAEALWELPMLREYTKPDRPAAAKGTFQYPGAFLSVYASAKPVGKI